MNFSEEHICFEVPGNSKQDILRYVADKAKDLNICEDSEGLLKDLLHREEEFSTGLQDGFAIPHARSEHVKEASILFLKTANGIDWGTMDGNQVHYMFSLLVPKENEGNVHLMMLSQLATCLLEDDFKDYVKSCEDKCELVTYIYKGMEGIA